MKFSIKSNSKSRREKCMEGQQKARERDKTQKEGRMTRPEEGRSEGRNVKKNEEQKLKK